MNVYTEGLHSARCAVNDEWISWGHGLDVMNLGTKHMQAFRAQDYPTSLLYTLLHGRRKVDLEEK